jgi:hypothetical protein
MNTEIQNPNLDSLVHCLKAPDISIAFGDVSDGNINDVYSEFDLTELFSRPQDHGAFIFHVNKDKTEDLYNALADDQLMADVAEMGENGLVCVYHGQHKDLVILLETNMGLNAKAYLEKHSAFGHSFYYFKEFYITIEMFNGEDKSFLDNLGGDVELFQVFRNLDINND